MSVGKVCNREVVFVSKDNTVTKAAQLMREHHVGSLVVVEGGEGFRKPVGILTDRDIVIEVVAEEVNVDKLLVGDIMSFDTVTVRESDGVSETIKLMRGKGVRRMLVVDDDGLLAGIITADDFIDLLAEEVADLSRLFISEQTREKNYRD